MHQSRNIILLIILTTWTLGLSAKSTKRGAGWDEHNVALNERHAEQLRPGVSWVYNWGPDAGTPAAYDDELAFMPMAWNGNYNEQRLRAWYKAHPESKYLLGFNEPNFADQARMTPAEAAAAWPRLEALAQEFGLRLVAPALNFSASAVGGRIWNPYEWYDEFFRLYPQAQVDCLAMHCYMNWYSANTWLATEYFYTDLYNPRKDCYGRYPHLVAFLDSYKEANGHFPRMMLTEFCSWENDGSITGPDFQIDQMTQKVQMLEKSDLIEGYAWFMANAGSGYSAYPYMSLFNTNTANATLSDLGKVYVYMSDFDTERFHQAGTPFAASDYIDATTDDRQVKVRSNSDTTSPMPLQVQLPSGAYPTYQIDVPADGDYTMSLRVKADGAASITPYIDVKAQPAVAVATSGVWTDLNIGVSLKSGHHTLMLYNSGSSPIAINAIELNAAGGVAQVSSDQQVPVQVYNTAGFTISHPYNTPGIKIAVYPDGTITKTNQIITY